MYKPTKEELGEVLRKHKLWLSGLEGGECAYLHEADLSNANLCNANLREADLSGANLREADLSYANLCNANLRHADLHDADLHDADLSCADLRRAVLSRADLNRAYLSNACLSRADLNRAYLSNADLRGANLREADLSNANLCNANLRHADLHDADLHDADLSDADLRNADLSGAKGLLSSADYMKANFEKTTDGYIVYKCFNGSYKAPPKWKIESGEVIEEEADSNRANSCGCGINVATLEWVKKGYPKCKIYKLLIKWEWLPGVVVPYNTDGKIRCERAMIIGVV